MDIYETPITLIICDLYGVAVAKRLTAQGLDVTVCSIQDKAANRIVDAGMAVTSSVAAACASAQVIITVLAYPEDVEMVYLDSDGVIAKAVPGSYILDLSSAKVQQAQELYAIAAVNDLHYLECPFLGTAENAEEGRLTCFVGGEQQDFEALRPLITVLAEDVYYQGIAGSGQAARLVEQTMLAGALLGAVEGFALADVYKLDRAALLNIFQNSDFRDLVLDNLLPKALDRNFEAGYPVAYLGRDVAESLDAADAQYLTLPLMETVYQILEMLCVVGGAHKGIQGVSLVYDEEDKCTEEGLDWSLAEDYPQDTSYDEDFDEEDFDIGHSHFEHNHGFGVEGHRRSGLPPFDFGMFYSDN